MSTEQRENLDAVLRQFGDCRWRLAGGAADAGIIDEDHRVGSLFAEGPIGQEDQADEGDDGIPGGKVGPGVA